MSLLRLILLGCGCISLPTVVALGEARPHWIWCDEQVGETVVSFSTRFSVTDAVETATLRFCGESVDAELFLNEHRFAVVEAYDPLRVIDLTANLAAGEHHLNVKATAVDGPSAFFLQLDLGFADGTTTTVVSNDGWTIGSGSQPSVSLGPVDRRYIIPKSRRVGITATDNYEQWKQALGAPTGTEPASFAVAPGFSIELLRTARSDEDSWVSMAFDRQGRIIIGKESQGLLRMKLSQDGAQVVASELVEATLKECRGLVFIGDDLFANANNSKGLYRLRFDGQDGFAAPELLFASSGGVGHGRNDLALGPDGKLYSIHGDAVDLPGKAIDYTSPFRAARRGQSTREGHLLRIDPETGDVELLAAGLRNPFGIDFNPAGDLFTYDADAEHDMGSPWYRPTRVSHLVVGGDYGWRGVTGTWPPYYPDHADNARPNLDIGKGSPTAVKFGTRSRFPKRFREALFILDWAYGRILAVHCLPRGSSYLLTAETFLQGRPLNVTDLDFGPDGAMYFVTGGRKTRSALYRVRAIGDGVNETQQPTVQQQRRESFVKQSRERRRRLESLLASPRPATAKIAVEHLGDPDPWIAQAAGHLLERDSDLHGVDDRLADGRAGKLRWFLARARDPSCERLTLLEQLNGVPLADADRSEKLMAMHAYSLCLTPDALASEGRVIAAVRAKLSDLYPDEAYEVNRSLSELLVRLRSPAVVQSTIELLREATDQAEQMHYLHVLRGVNEGWTMSARRTYFSALNQSQHFLAGAGMPGFLAKIREEAIATLTAEERQQLADQLESRPATLQFAPQPGRKIVRQWTVAEAMKALPETEPDVERGKRMFVQASCAQCHRVAGYGTLVGPDLTAAGSRFGRRDLLTSILEPSRVIAENYRSVSIVTEEGRTYVGQPRLSGDYRSPLLRLATDATKPLKTIEIDKRTIELQKPSAVSWMPKGLVDTLTIDEIHDLLGYIESASHGLR